MPGVLLRCLVETFFYFIFELFFFCMISVCFINILLLFSLLLLFQFYSGVHYEHIPYKHMLNMYTETHDHTHKCLHVCTCKHHPSIRRSSVYEHRCWVCVLKIVLQTFVSELYKTNKKYKNIRVNHNTPNRTSFCLPCLPYCKHFSLSLSRYSICQSYSIQKVSE